MRGEHHLCTRRGSLGRAARWHSTPDWRRARSEGVCSVTSPQALIIAGPNGSGKSTLTGQLAAQGISVPAEYINPDDIARRLREEIPEAPQKEIEQAAFQLGRQQRQEYREK